MLNFQDSMDSVPPSKRPFFKYASPETTLAILRNRTVRYSSPKSFNDPFDVQSGLHLNFDLNTLPTKTIERLSQYASALEPPPVNSEDVWGKLVLEVRRLFPTHGFPRERWNTETSQFLAQLSGTIKNIREDILNHWRLILPGVRVFCVSEDRDNLLMWAHYAKDHTGAVLEFWSLPEEDNPLSVARPVQYVKEPPSFFSDEEFLDHIFSVKELDVSALQQRYVYAKSVHWAYEREWRVWYPLPTDGLFDDMPIRQSEFAAVYFDCRAHPDFVAEVRALLCQQFPNVCVYQATRLEDVYALHYTNI